MHKLAVALDFFYSTCARIGRADFQRAVAKILGQPLAEDMVSRSDLTKFCIALFLGILPTSNFCGWLAEFGLCE